MNLILIEPHEIDAGGCARLAGPRAAHLRETLAAEPGQTVRVGLVDGPLGSARVESCTETEAVLRCEFSGGAPARPRVDLLLALPRPKVLKRLWAQLAALGVGRILLSNAWKVEKNYFDTHVLDPAFYRPLLLEGLQQARDTRLPEVTVHRRFKVLVEDELDALCPEGQRLLADPAYAKPIGASADPARRALLAVGPEGGWTDYERELLESRGFTGAGLGPRTLRTDTAVIALLALVHEALG